MDLNGLRNCRLIGRLLDREGGMTTLGQKKNTGMDTKGNLKEGRRLNREGASGGGLYENHNQDQMGEGGGVTGKSNLIMGRMVTGRGKER